MSSSSDRRKSKSGFWSFVERKTAGYGYTVQKHQELKSEGLVLIDQAACIFFRPAGRRRWLTFGGGDYGVLALTCQRLLVRLDTFVLIDLPIDSRSFKELPIELTKNGELRFSAVDVISPLNNQSAWDQVVTETSTKSRRFFDLIRLAQTDLVTFDSQFCADFFTHEEPDDS